MLDIMISVPENSGDDLRESSSGNNIFHKPHFIINLKPKDYDWQIG